MSRGSDWGGCTLPTVSSSEEGGGASKLRKHNSIWILMNSLTDFPNDEREGGRLKMIKKSECLLC